VALEGVAQGGGHCILNSLELAIYRGVLGIRPGPFAGVKLDKPVGEAADGALLALLQAPAPKRLHRRGFADFQGDTAQRGRGATSAKALDPKGLGRQRPPGLLAGLVGVRRAAPQHSSQGIAYVLPRWLRGPLFDK